MSQVHQSSTYTLELPAALQKRRIVPTFHVALLQPYHANNDVAFPDRTQLEPYDFGAPDDQEWFVDEILGHPRTSMGREETGRIPSTLEYGRHNVGITRQL